MLQSALFTKTRREAPKDEVSKNAQLLIRAGYIHKEMAGVYSYLPLGLQVLKKIENIIREEMNAIGGQEVLLTTLQDPKVWQASGRWSDKEVDIWFKSKLAGGGEVGIANTHEEPLANLLTQHVHSHKDLPLYIYQIQNKFRNELRAKSGLIRGREFIMKDMYSFVRSEEELLRFHEKCAGAYMKIFSRVGTGELTYRTFASGGSFSKYSDEFQTLSGAGEDTIYVDKGKRIGVNKEVYTDEVLHDLGLSKDSLQEERAIEVGNIFKLGTRFSNAAGLFFKDESGNEQPVIMGSYGIGLGRLMGTIVEVLSDEKGIVWPRSVSPFVFHLVSLPGAKEQSETLYKTLMKEHIEVLFDDRPVQAGEKFSDSDLIGIPYRIVMSEKNAERGRYEIAERKTGKAKEVTEKELFSLGAENA